MLSDIDYAAYFQYSVRGQTDTSKNSRRVRDGVKGGNNDLINCAISQMHSLHQDENWCSDWFTGGVTLIPVPKSAPLVDKDSLWVPKKICEAMLACGIGDEINLCLVRDYAVKKSAFQTLGNRPDAQQHYNSMHVKTNLVDQPYDTILLVDDVIARGATMTASCSLVTEAFPSTRVLSFALMRAKGFHEVDEIIDPFIGRIINSRRKD